MIEQTIDNKISKKKVITDLLDSLKTCRSVINEAGLYAYYLNLHNLLIESEQFIENEYFDKIKSLLDSFVEDYRTLNKNNTKYLFIELKNCLEKADRALGFLTQRPDFFTLKLKNINTILSEVKK